MLSPLEKLGLEVAAERLLCGNRGLGRLLSVLIQADGRTVSKATLRDAQVQLRGGEPATMNSVAVRICKLRAALADVGLEGVIATDWGKGYSIPIAEPVLAALTEEASA